MSFKRSVLSISILLVVLGCFSTRQESRDLDCDFDSSFCKWYQLPSRDFDWKLYSSRSPPVLSGPSASRAGRGRFAMIDPPESLQQHDRSADIASPFLSPGQYCLTLWYFMWGDQVNTLEVSYLTKHPLVIWKREGTQGKEWVMAGISINLSARSQLKITAYAGFGPRGNIAIDDTSLKSGLCSQDSQGLTNATCDFESGLCGYKQDQGDKTEWILNKGVTSFWGTGPSVDHTYQTVFGSYIYLRGGTAQEKDNARLISSSLNILKSGMCLQFWFHMYGSGMGTLYVKLKSHEKETILWEKSGNQGLSWQRDMISISPNYDQVNIIFEGVRGYTHSSDVAIDDIALLSGTCSIHPGDCDFEIDTCSWTNANISFSWKDNDGSVPTLNTGPSSGHGGQGRYQYVESSAPTTEGDTAILESELFPPQDSCFHFFYNMYGQHMGTLRVGLALYPSNSDPDNINDQQILWEVSGNQGQSWLEGVVPIHQFKNDSFRILISGIVGSDATSDIAIDDLKFWTYNDSCQLRPQSAVPLSTFSPTYSFTTAKPLPGCDGYCYNNGQCSVDGNGLPKCLCVDSYHGPRCSQNRTDHPLTNPTVSISKHSETVQSSTFSVVESTAYSNATIQTKSTDKSGCDGYCYNNGQCSVDGNGLPKCLCMNSYHGPRCNQNRTDHPLTHPTVSISKHSETVQSTTFSVIESTANSNTAIQTKSTDKNGCDGYCYNNGQCSVEGDGLRKCLCLDGYHGPRCSQSRTNRPHTNPTVSISKHSETVQSSNFSDLESATNSTTTIEEKSTDEKDMWKITVGAATSLCIVSMAIFALLLYLRKTNKICTTSSSRSSHRIPNPAFDYNSLDLTSQEELQSVSLTASDERIKDDQDVEGDCTQLLRQLL